MSPPAASSPFHPGEQQLQQSTGVREVMEARGRQFIRDHMPNQHRDFFATLPLVVIGALDEQAHPWATVMAGPPGFMHSADPQTLHLGARLLAHDPLASHWRVGAPLGLLGIQPHTRRRNRMNGVLSSLDAQGRASVSVRQSFGNCPKYIRPREASWVGEASSPVVQAAHVVLDEGPILSRRAQGIVEQADTFFIASASPHAHQEGVDSSEGVDVSHRGGPAGFVKLSHDGEGMLLTVPDYTGNFMFNTLGNIVSQPKVGLLFMDFARSALLWLQGLAWVDQDSPEQAEHEGALRLLRVRITRGRLDERGWPLTWVEG